jgi:hypothetical protein
MQIVTLAGNWGLGKMDTCIGQDDESSGLRCRQWRRPERSRPRARNSLPSLGLSTRGWGEHEERGEQADRRTVTAVQ